MSRDRRIMGWLFVLVTFSCTYFFTGGGWNQASRFNLVRAIVEQGTLTIDAYHGNTGDVALWQGHYYCDKAPGTSFLAVPFAAATRFVARILTDDPAAVLMAQARVALLVCSAIPTASASLALFFIAGRLGARPRGATLVALAYGLGTPAWAYGTFFWGHALSAACLVVSFALAISMTRSHWTQRSPRASLVMGLLLGWAVLTEYTALVAAAILLAFLVVELWRGEPVKFWPCLSWAALGALGPALLLLGYNRLAFGSFAHIGYGSVVGFAGMQQGIFGVSTPRLDVLGELLWGKRRGLLLLSPILLPAPVGFALLSRDPRKRPVVITALAVFAYYLLLNASYFYWDGGFSYGPRHLAAGLPFLCVGLIVPALGSRGLSVPVKGLVLVSIALTLVAIAVAPMTPPVEWPWRDIFWPGLMDGRLSQNDHPYFDLGATPAANLGESLGLRGLASVVPLLAVWYLIGKRLEQLASSE